MFVTFSQNREFAVRFETRDPARPTLGTYEAVAGVKCEAVGGAGFRADPALVKAVDDAFRRVAEVPALGGVIDRALGKSESVADQRRFPGDESGC